MRGRTHRKTRKNRKSGGFTSKDVQVTAASGGFKPQGELAATRKSGGFMPSVMGSFVANARMLTPLAIAAGYRLVDNAKQVRKNRVHTRSKAKSRRKRQ